jgi:hypothetical protein
MFEEVNNAIFELEDLQDILEFQSKREDHEYQLALYKEKQLLEFNLIKGKKYKY